MSGTEETTPSYQVKVFDWSGMELNAYLEPVLEPDLPPRSSPDWTFDWRGFWQNTDFECEAIIKLSCRGEIFGLVRFGLYPYPFPDDAPHLNTWKFCIYNVFPSREGQSIRLAFGCSGTPFRLVFNTVSVRLMGH